jgi:hypothetical protein
VQEPGGGEGRNVYVPGDDVNSEDILPELPPDTQLALEMVLHMREEARAPEQCPRLVLRTQIYNELRQHEDVDRELDQLVRDGVIRQVKMITEADEYGVIFTRALEEDVEARCVHLPPAQQSMRPVIEEFLRHVLRACPEISITRARLQELLYPKLLPELRRDTSLDLLVRFGLLVMKDVDSFWFSVPNLGAFKGAMWRMRKELIKCIRAKRWREMLFEDLREKAAAFKFSHFGLEFHLRDLLGRGLVEKVDTTAGLLIRLRRS